MESDSTLWRFEGLFNLPMMWNKLTSTSASNKLICFCKLSCSVTNWQSHRFFIHEFYLSWKLRGASLTAWWAQRQTANFLPTYNPSSVFKQLVTMSIIYLSHLFPSIQLPLQVLPIYQVNNICLLLWWHAAANHGSEHVAAGSYQNYTQFVIQKGFKKAQTIYLPSLIINFSLIYA